MKSKTENFYSNGLFIYSEKEPFLIGKIVKLQHEDDAEDYKTKQVGYNFEQVPGFNIFIVQAGFHPAPKAKVSDADIKAKLAEMCKWFRDTKINKIINRLYKAA